jgi:hypothetical protein
MTAATTAVAVAAPPTSTVPAAAAGPGATVVEIPDDDDDVPLPGWDQWESMPASVPEASAEALVAHGGTGAALGARQTASGPRRRALDPRRTWSRGRRGLTPRRPTTSMLRQSRGFGRSSASTTPLLNRALDEALWIHGGPAWRTFQVS